MTERYALPKNIERYIAALSKLYAREDKGQLQEIIVNSQIRVHEGWSSDNWNGGTYGHALYLAMPEPLFLSCVKKKIDLQNQIKEDLNKIHNYHGESIEEVFFEMEMAEAQDWRKESGLLLVGKRVVAPDISKRIWGGDGFRVFLSHKSEVKKEVADLKKRLGFLGVSCFVAHEDIHPTKTWQDEIENALASMDAFVALMTPSFHDSDWTDQEVGFAFARSVPIIAVRLGKDPYGFIGKFQALSSAWETAAEDIVKVLIKNEAMFTAYIKVLRNCSSWDTGNTLSKILPAIEKLTRSQLDELINVYNETSELQGSFGFTGSKPRLFGPGLPTHLNRIDPSSKFQFSHNGLIEIVL